MKKRFLALVLTVLCVILLIPACGDDDFRPPEEVSTLPTEAPKETLQIVANAGFENEQFGGEDDLRHVIEYFGGLPSGIDIELEVLPIEEADLHARLTRLRTEIFAGKGPDVFLMAAPALPEREVLFPIPQQAMERKIFLPLDELAESAEHMDWDGMNPQILAAGRGSEGQMLLPMFYGYDLAAADEPLDAVPASYDEAIASENPVIRDGCASAFHFGFFRDLALSEVADYENEELLVTEEELNRRIKEACVLSYDRENARAEWTDSFAVLEDHGETVFPLYNVGGITARVNSYLAVNRNTAHKEDALALVDMMLSREFLSLEAFWSEERPKMQTAMFLFTALNDWNGSNPVYDDLLGNGGTMEYVYSMPESREEDCQKVLGSINRVYIPTSIDQEIKKLYKDCLAVGDESEIDKLVSKCYSTMKMMLAES